MNRAVTPEPTAQYADTLIHLPTRADQLSCLADAGLDHAAGLERLLALVATLIRTNPTQARRLAQLCIDLAPQLDAAALIPRAAYLQAQTHAIDGDFAPALALIQTARDGYAVQGETLSALRTNVGLMHVLNELGRHQEAVEVAHGVLAQLEQIDAEDAQLIRALIHHNLGVCYRLMGQYEAALGAYAAAETHYRAADMPERLGDIFNNRGLILLHLGRVTDALAAFREAAVTRQQAGHTLLYAQTLVNVGDAYLQQGQFTDSLSALNEAHELLTGLDSAAQKQVLQLQRGLVYLALNLYPEAIPLLRDAAEQGRAAGMTHYTAQALWGLGAALAAAGQHEAAGEALADAAVLFAEAENVPLLVGVQLEQAALAAARGERQTAVRLAQTALQSLDEGQWPVQQLYAHLRLADLYGDAPQQAESHLQAAEPLLDALPLPQLCYRWQQRMGQLRRQQGDVAAARGHLETAVDTIEQLRGTVAQEAMRVSFLRDKMAAYDALLRLHLQQDDVAAAFAVSERAKSRTLLDLISGVQPASATASSATVAARVQTLQADLNAVYNAFLGAGATEETTAVSPATLRQRARDLEAAIRQERLTATSHSVQDVIAAPLGYNAIRDQLADDVALVAYHLLDDEIIAFVAADGPLRVVRRVSRAATVQALLQRLATQWSRFRLQEQFLQRHMVRLTETCRRILAELHRALFAPLESLLPAVGKVVVVPHDLLHQVPFAALHDGHDYLIDRYEISTAPSGTVLASCRQRQRAAEAQSLLLAAPDEAIPHVHGEMAAVAARLNDAAVFENEAATTAVYRRQAPHSGLIHLACHGLFRADNPMFSALKLHDRWLTAADILPVALNGPLVTLSACESGRSHVDAGDELLGLAWAFLGAGAGSLVVSQWIAHDETTATLMADWYTRMQTGEAPVAALRAAQLAMKGSYPHPYYWAPFTFIGKR